MTKYEWSLNGTVVATTATYEVPAIAKSGDRIKVTVTAEDGETASDSVYVGGFSILKVEPTTAMTPGTGTKGYKYVRATFSNALNSLSEADIVIRNVKTDQLYSVEKVALSTDGYTADITIAGDAAVAGTTFLMPSTIYSCTISSDGLDATLEFQLPNVLSDMMVTKVDVAKATITVEGSVREGGTILSKAETFNVGDTYDGNLGELVGRTLVLGVDADDNITSLKVNDGAVAFGYVTAKDGNNDGNFDSRDDYFETTSGEKYYLSATTTSASNETYGIWADNSGVISAIDNMVDLTDTVGTSKFEYGKLVLNPNGTVSAAVLLPAFDGHIIATTAEGSVATETSDNSKDFKDYIVIDGLTLNYVDPTDISDGDIIYYAKKINDVALIYNDSVTGDLENVYKDRVVVDGEKYNYIVNNAAGAVVKQARYYDADNDKYEDVTEKWANTIDKDEPVTLYLDTKGDIRLVDATVGETVTHSKTYIITKSPKAYKNGLTQMMDMAVSDGTEVTLHISANDITSINGDAFGDVTFSVVDTPGTTTVDDKYEFDINDNDGKKTKVNADGSKTPNGDKNHGSDSAVHATTFQQGGLVEVIYNDDETVVKGLNIKLDAQNTQGEPQLRADADTEFKGGLASIKTTGDGSLTLSADTKVYVLSGTRLPVGSLENDTSNDLGPTTMKEATDNKVKVYNYSDFDLNTKPGSTKIKLIDNEGAATDGSAIHEEADGTETGPTISSLVTFLTDKTAAKAVIIDNRGWNNAKNATVLPLVGSVGKEGDAKGGQVFKNAKTETKYLGVATGTEYKLKSDGVTHQLASLTILTKDGSITLDTFADDIDTDKDAKGKIVVAELDSTGKVQKVNEGANDATNAPKVDTVSYGAIRDTESTTTLSVGGLAGGTYNLQTDANCLVVKFDGNTYKESSIGDINRDDDYHGVKFMTSQLSGTDAKATVILATKDSSATAALTASLDAFTTAASALAANTDPAQCAALKLAADNAKTAADTAIANYNAAYGAHFATDTATAAEQAQYVTDAQAITDYTNAKTLIDTFNKTNIKPASLAVANADTKDKLATGIVGKINNTAITTTNIGLGDLDLMDTAGTAAGSGIAGDQWIGNVLIVKSGYAVNIAISATDWVLTV